MYKTKQYLFILFCFLCMLALLMIVLLKEMDRPPMELLYVQDRVTGQQIEPYYEESEDTYYLYLPGYASKKTVKLSLRAPALVNFQDAEGKNYGFNMMDVPGGDNCL